MPLTSQLRTASRTVSIKYVGPLAAYKIVDPHNYLLITLDGKLLRGLLKHERLKPAVIRTNQGNLTNLSIPDYYCHNKNNDDVTNYAQLLEIQINDKMKMDRRFFPMQDIKVRHS